jgi:hypothetical protein
MRRRDFLVGSVGIASGLLGGSGRAAVAPCPPDTLRVRGGSAARSTCARDVPAGGPTWFQDLRAMEWTPLAGGPGMAQAWQCGERLAEAVPPPPYFKNRGPRYLTAGWNGACVDPDNMEMIVALNGGHAARQENDAYLLKLGSETPGWRRIVESTPAVDPQSGDPFMTGLAVLDATGARYQSPVVVPGWLLDGPHPGIAYNDRDPDLARIRRRPRTLHTCSHYHYSNGKVWYPIMNAWDRGTGETSLVKLALDMSALRADSSLGAWRYGDPGPWQYVGVIGEQTGGATDAFGFGVGDLDPSTGKLWYAGQRTSTYWSVETIGAGAGQHSFYSDAPRDKDLSSSAGAIAHGIRTAAGNTTSLFVMMEQGTHRLWILDTSLAGTGRGWSVVEPVNASTLQWAHNLQKVVPGYVGHAAAFGMVYLENARCFLAYNCDQLPDRAAVRVLRIPLRADGSYDPHGQWRWSEERLGDAGPDDNNPRAPGIGGGGGSYTRFNCLPNFAGTNESLLIHLSRHDRPTWVCRLPASAFT